MGKFYDLTGMRFGILTVVSLAGRTNNGQKLWQCKCDCGNTIQKNTSNIILSKTKTLSCGCTNTAPIGGKDHTGKKYKKLTALKKLDKRAHNGCYFWVCKCDCGNLTEISASYLGRTTSCGCFKKERMTGKNSPVWKGGISIDNHGYRRIRVNGKRLPEHRVVYEQHYNIKLLPHQNIHHINGDKLDNRIENLELWDTSQPAGQRIEDKILYYGKLISEYKNHPKYESLIKNLTIS